MRAVYCDSWGVKYWQHSLQLLPDDLSRKQEGSVDHDITLDLRIHQPMIITICWVGSLKYNHCVPLPSHSCHLSELFCDPSHSFSGFALIYVCTQWWWSWSPPIPQMTCIPTQLTQRTLHQKASKSIWYWAKWVGSLENGFQTHSS